MNWLYTAIGMWIVVFWAPWFIGIREITENFRREERLRSRLQ